MISVLLKGNDEEKILVLAALGELGHDAITSKYAIEYILKSQDSHMQFLAALTLSKVVEGYKSDLFLKVLRNSLESYNSDEALMASSILTNLTNG